MANGKARHFIITNRNIYKRGKKEFINDDGTEGAGHDLRFGEIFFDPSSTISKVTGDYYNLFPDPPELDLADDLSDPTFGVQYSYSKDKNFGSTILFEELNHSGIAARDNAQHILVYIHGYKCDLKTAFETVQSLHNLYVDDPESPIENIVLFTWPAMKKYLEYRDDAQDAVISGYALARAFKKLQRFFRDIAQKMRHDEGGQFCHQKVHLMCHSMGNRVLEAMFDELNNTNTKVNSVFGEVLLMAPDVDYDSFEAPKPLHNLIEIGERVHIYFHRHDRALGISELTKNAFNRLGRWGAKNTLALPDDVIQADVTGVKKDKATLFEGAINHWYYLNSSAVVKDVIEVVNGEISNYAV